MIRRILLTVLAVFGIINGAADAQTRMVISVTDLATARSVALVEDIIEHAEKQGYFIGRKGQPQHANWTD